MLYAIFAYPENGYDYDKKEVEKAGLKIDKRYEVENVSMGQSYTSISLKDIGEFNSVHFEFEEDGEIIDIFSDKRYNPYLSFFDI